MGNTTVIKDAEDKKIIKRYGVYNNGEYNQCCMVEGIDKPLRERSEILIFRGNKLLVNTKTSKNQYLSKFPGGSLDKNESPLNAAVREAKEEVRINIKNPSYIGRYITLQDEPKRWVKENIPEEDWWYGYYTYLHIGEYDSRYLSHIKLEDMDKMILSSKFVDIDKCYHKLTSYHRKAVDIYLKNKKESRK